MGIKISTFKKLIALLLVVTVTALQIPSTVTAKATTVSTVADTVDTKINEEKPQEDDEDKVGVINVHYYKNGQWKEIDNTLEEAKNSDFNSEESNEKSSNEKNALKNKKNK